MKIEVLIIARYLYIFLQIIASLHLLIPFILVILYAGRIAFFGAKKPDKANLAAHNFKFGVIITAYKESVFIPPIIDSLLKQTYSNLEIYCVADCCDISGLNYSDPRIHILVPSEALNSNVRSIQYALDHFSPDIEILTLFDPDNLVHHLFFAAQNTYFNKGYLAVQAAIRPKNTRGYYARIDTIGSKFYGFIDRSARSFMGLSANIWGCGISVFTDVYRNIQYDHRSDMGGFDKHLQAEIALNVPVIAYAQEAILYDEKIADYRNLENQRIRWINAYFKFFKDGWQVFLTGMKRRDFNLIFFGFNLLRPPYFIQILTGLVFIGLNSIILPAMEIYWVICFSLFLISIFLIMLTDNSVSTYDGLLVLPLFFYHQIRALINLRMNKKSNLQTSHSEVLYIEDMVRE